MNIIFCLLFLFANMFFSVLQAEDYLLSSEPLVQRASSSLEGYRGFVFLPLIHMSGKEKEVVMGWIEQELQKKGVVKKERFLKEDGADFKVLSHPFLTFSLQQIVTQDDKQFPLIRATMYTSTSVEILINHKFKVIPTNEWSMYLKREKVIQVVKKSFSELLDRFLSHYASDNSRDQKPIFYLIDTPVTQESVPNEKQ